MSDLTLKCKVPIFAEVSVTIGFVLEENTEMGRFLGGDLNKPVYGEWYPPSMCGISVWRRGSSEFAFDVLVDGMGCTSDRRRGECAENLSQFFFPNYFQQLSRALSAGEIGRAIPTVTILHRRVLRPRLHQTTLLSDGVALQAWPHRSPTCVPSEGRAPKPQRWSVVARCAIPQGNTHSIADHNSSSSLLAIHLGDGATVLRFQHRGRAAVRVTRFPQSVVQAAVHEFLVRSLVTNSPRLTLAAFVSSVTLLHVLLQKRQRSIHRCYLLSSA